MPRMTRTKSHINNRSEFGYWEIDTVIRIKDKSTQLMPLLKFKIGVTLFQERY